MALETVWVDREISKTLREKGIRTGLDLLRLALDKEKKYIRKDRENIPSVKDTDAAHTAIIPTGVAAKNLTEEEAQKKGLPYGVGRAYHAEMPRGKILL